MARCRPTTLLAGLLLLAAPGPAAAEDLAKFPVLGLRLGDDLAAARARHPDLFVETYDYEHPEVGARYEAALGERLPDRHGARGLVAAPGGAQVELQLAFTGDGRLYELQAWERRAGRIDCGAEMRRLRERYGGAPDVQVRDDRAQWIERRGEVDRMLEIQCFREGRLLSRLVDANAQEAYRAGLRERLEPYVDQVRQQR